METITISDIDINIIRKDIKNIHLAVYPPTGRVRIAAPKSLNDDAIRLFAISKLSWIKRQQKRYKEQDRITKREYKYRESHYFLGQRYLLNVIEKEAAPKVVVKGNTYIDLYVRPGTPANKRQNIMNEWYRSELKNITPDIVHKWENKVGVKVNDWRVKLMKTKWGSCTIERSRIWLNLELAKKPVHCIEYIIVHEMVHLLERHHHDVFKRYMDQYLPNWRFLKDELNRIPLQHENWKY